ncbi:hypothetical protein HG535_0H01800 [Zygotorulaspora mrakii]|uniref:USP domain-containing protein n=1 Tax=Zygotorulaspora mrakii TaxID=42260 RepID=A0A7H9B8J9_ZYGMR|nr:uncharacterized protein HG535_0H01800 [Zygotorulaspora mrakii]QLG74853.1 hypothetical protein HG535_0H01800 [Zygotorulaspora mrakii]
MTADLAEKRRKSDDADVGACKKVHGVVSRSLYAYLETIDRKKLDFDFEKVCSVTLSPLNVYCCLVCGKYFQGRRQNSPAFLHAVNENHRVYINVKSLKVYLLPNGVEVKDENKIEAINQIRYAISPTFSENEIRQFPRDCWDLNNNHYLNGYVSLTNTSRNDCANVAIMLLAHIIPIRDFLLLLPLSGLTQFLEKLSMLVKKVWSVSLFKQHVSVDEFLSFVAVTFKGSITVQQDPRYFLLWLINSISKVSKEMRDLLVENCQGIIEINETFFKSVKDDKGDVQEFIRDEANQKNIVSPFWTLSLDLLPKPVFKDGLNANSLPQVQLEELLKKFNGSNEHHLPHCVRRYKLKKLPRYLILHFDRFNKKDETPVKSRNQTLIEFPTELKIGEHKYSLVSNIVHEGEKESTMGTTRLERDENSHWKIQLRYATSSKWIEIDRSVLRFKEKELLFLSESYMQVWKKIES